MKLTPWYPGHIKPVRKGVYQLWSGTRDKIGYQYWDGAFWRSWYSTPETAFSARNSLAAGAMFQNDEWRGIAK